MVDTKQCSGCHRILPITEFTNKQTTPDGKSYHCKQCETTARQRYRGTSPYDRNPSCPMYLGVYIAEPLLRTVYPNATRMPTGNEGYDYVCGKGFKIDVKSACYADSGYWWYFNIRQNTVADYFLCIAFDSRQSMVPLHCWLIPGNLVNTKKLLRITDSNISLVKWASHELDITKLKDTIKLKGAVCE